MTPRSKNILVGLFVVSLTAGAALFLAWLGASKVRQETDTYLVQLSEAVSGLSNNADVKYKGVQIGQVTRIRIDPGDSNLIELTLQVQRGTPIKVDSRAVLTSRGITGIQYVEITGGGSDSPPLVGKGGKPPVIPEGRSTISTVVDALGPLLDNIGGTVREIKELLEAAQPERLNRILDNVEAISGEMVRSAEGLTGLMGDARSVVGRADGFLHDRTDTIDRVLNNVDQLTLKMNDLLQEADRRDVLLGVAESVEDLRGIMAELREAVDEAELGRTTATLERAVGDYGALARNLNHSAEAGDVAQTLAELREALRAFQEMSASLTDLSRRLRDQPNALLFGAPPPAGPR